MNLIEVRNFLEKHIREDFNKYFGLKDSEWIDQVTSNWFDDANNYDGRWKVIRERTSTVKRILDMAAGCGTFVLYGLQNGYNVWGVEPKEWKREYYRRKVLASNYPSKYLSHIVAGIGEALPFEDKSFDFITTYQTLEHVSDVNKCLKEMLRVLKHNGILYIRAPDYNCFFEPHYRIPFFPIINKKVAAIYLKIIRKPILGLQNLQWITEKKVIKYLKMSTNKVNIERTNQIRRLKKIKELLPRCLRIIILLHILNFAHGLKIMFYRFGRTENNIDLWVRKIE